MSAAAGLVLLAAGCSGSPSPSGGQPGINPGAADPYARLPACRTPEGSGRSTVETVLPPGAVVTSSQSEGPVTTVTGFVAMTPVQVRAFYERDQTRLTVRQAEDEIYEAEVFGAVGQLRQFIKATAICRDGSQLMAVAARGRAASAVPTPSGGPTPTGTGR